MTATPAPPPSAFALEDWEIKQILRQRELIRQGQDWITVDLRDKFILDFGRFKRENLTRGGNSPTIKITEGQRS